MSSTELRHAGAEEVEAWLKIVEEEQLVLPTAHQRALVARKTTGCLQPGAGRAPKFKECLTGCPSRGANS